MGQEANEMRYLEMQEEMQAMEQAIALVEEEELNAVSRLQNSQSVHAQALSQLHQAKSLSVESGLDLDEGCDVTGTDSLYGSRELLHGRGNGYFSPPMRAGR